MSHHPGTVTRSRWRVTQADADAHVYCPATHLTGALAREPCRSPSISRQQVARYGKKSYSVGGYSFPVPLPSSLGGKSHRQSQSRKSHIASTPSPSKPKTKRIGQGSTPACVARRPRHLLAGACLVRTNMRTPRAPPPSPCVVPATPPIQSPSNVLAVFLVLSMLSKSHRVVMERTVAVVLDCSHHAIGPVNL